MSSRLCLPLLAFLALSTGCAHRLECHAHGGPEWRELTNDHFRLTTDLDEPTAKRELDRLELARDALLILYGNLKLDVVLDVVVMKDADAVHEFDENALGFEHRVRNVAHVNYGFAEPDDEDPPRTLVASTPLHELVHAFEDFFASDDPRWLTEGFAMYFETAEFDAQGTHVTFGKYDAQRVYDAYVDGALTPDELEQFPDGAGEETQRYYSSAYAWTHFLEAKYSRELQSFRRRVASSEDPHRAFASEFATVKASNVDQYMRSGQYTQFTFPIERSASGAMKERTLSPAEVHLLRARLFRDGTNAGTSAAQNAELEMAKTLGPTELPVLRAECEGLEYDHVDVACAEKLVHAHPEDAASWALLGRAYRQASFSNRARWHAPFLKAHELGSDDVDVWDALADERNEARDYVTARGYINHALAVAPWRYDLLNTLAMIEANRHRCDEAHDALDRFVAVARLRKVPENVELANEERKSIKGYCAELMKTATSPTP